MSAGEQIAADVRRDLDETRRALLSLVRLFNRRCEREGAAEMRVPLAGKDRRVA